ncbi:chemotaxis response regulator protein-glutamate methylesterase [Treponema sp.]|uniref:protein-glutamate methylesterase/protein-glutamine glutaminase n=1 Tax=Treponema sp. TaxID=166 RepID=UPI00388D77AE
MDDIEVLVCDDSALMRNLITRIIEGTDGMKVCGTAMNGKFALQKLESLKPDLILLDIEMPEMNGVQFLEERKKKGLNVPVVILSSIATEGASVTMNCLELGASDFITKPSGSTSSSISSVGSAIIEKIASYGGRYARLHGKQIPSAEHYMQQAKLKEIEAQAVKDGIIEKPKDSPVKAEPSFSPTLFSSSTKKKDPDVITPEREGGPIDIVVLGISTGGPNALREVFKNLDPKFPKPILVVQHMPAGFTKEFAASLDRICPLNVKEAEDGDPIHPGQIYIAPGNYHIVIEKSTLCNVIRLSDADLRNGHRPSADWLFESCAKIYKNRALGVIMTGMGRDGAVQLAEMRKQGAWTIGQDEESSVVYGMPRVAWELGAVQKQVSLEKMAEAMNNIVKEHSK